jgi:hypothetical protein
MCGRSLGDPPNTYQAAAPDGVKRGLIEFRKELAAAGEHNPLARQETGRDAAMPVT